MRVKCLAQEHNAMSPARPRTRTTRSGVERTNHEATAWYEHDPKTVVEKDDITILCDMPIQTDRTITANRPDIVIKNKRENKCTLIDVAIPSDKHTSIKVSKKLSKYKDLEIEIARMWQMRTVVHVIPVVVGALGVIKKGTEKHPREIPGTQPTGNPKNSTSGSSTNSEKGSLNQVNRTNTPLVP